MKKQPTNFLFFLISFFQMTKEEKQESQHQKSIIRLVPELLRIHPLPSSLYVQSKLLLSSMHRIQRLLLAEEIRNSVSEHCKITEDWLSTSDQHENRKILLSYNITKIVILMCIYLSNVWLVNFKILELQRLNNYIKGVATSAQPVPMTQVVSKQSCADSSQQIN